MIQLKMYPTSINMRHVELAVDALRRGDTIIYPTDTLYALGCDALQQRAVERICRIKGINPDKTNLSVICADLSQASRYARIDNNAYRLIHRHLPGPFTFILPAASTLPKAFKGRKTVGLRIPDNPITLAIARALDGPILTTSADADTPGEETDAEALALRYRDSASLIIDGGDCGSAMQPSTIVDLTDSSSPQIIRQGAGSLTF